MPITSRHFADTIIPAIDQFQPDFILLSAGFDAHRSDPLGQILLSADGYGQLTELVLQLATRHCEGRLRLPTGGRIRLRGNRDFRGRSPKRPASGLRKLGIRN